MLLLPPRIPVAATTLYAALLLPALPVDDTELSGESEKYSATSRLADGKLNTIIVNKVSGHRVSTGIKTKATKLTKIRFLDTKDRIIVHGKVGSQGEIRFELNAKRAAYIDRIHHLRSESENYAVSVRLTEPEEWAEWNRVLDITVEKRALGAKVSRRTPTRTAKLTELYILEAEQRLIVHGQIGSRGDILTVVNLKDASVVDTIYGWKASFSPTKTRVAYNFRYPPHSMNLHRTSVLLIYDFAATPRQNSFRDKDMADPTTRGYVIYPQRNRKRGKHFIPAMDPEEWIDFASPIAWSHNGTRVALLEVFQDNTYLLLVDLAKGLKAPEIRRIMLEKESFYKQPIEIYWRKSYERANVGAKSLRFSKGDQSVIFTTVDGGPFAEQQAVIELD